MIAKKREVAATMWQVFRGANVKLGNWRQVTVSRKRLTDTLPETEMYRTRTAARPGKCS